MLFRLLGPLEVTNGDHPVRIGAGRQRGVLLMLLLHRNELVASERLVDELWGEEPPASAAKVLQNAVGQLRRALDDREGRRLQTHGHGYVLRIAADELDIDRFEDLVRDGGMALADDRPANAAAWLREALALWRGPPLADVTYEAFAQGEIARLEELFATASERRVEADMALGAHADLIAELEGLVAQHPLREHLRAQQMLALYRCGRQADALEVFRQGRRVLIDEVGVEPGPELRDLHEAILRHDSRLELQRVELPRELDAGDAPTLVGRTREMQWLLAWWHRALDGDGAVIALTGEPGMGKTRLAAELAREVQRAGGLVFYVGAGPPASVADTIDRAARAAQPALVVVEDAESADGTWPAAGPTAAGALLVLVTADAPERLAGLPVAASMDLAGLGRDAVGAIVSAYTPDGATAAMPAEALLAASRGVPGRVHELASTWAAEEAARRVVDIAPSAAADRSQLRLAEEQVAGRVVELQEARERLDRSDYDDAIVVCPFKGLASFEFADARYFSGRERLIAALVARAVGAPLLGVVGPSGSGKSSLVKAGLLPALASGVLPSSAAWRRTVIRPGEHPMREIARLDLSGADAIVLAVDQFEELFTACQDESERLAFVEALVRTADRQDRAGLVVVALRADYYGRCAAYPALSRLVGANHVLVGPMDGHELRRAIERPAARAGLEVDRDLADAIVADVEGEPGALPLVSSALLELWQRRDGRRLRHETYEATGGVRGAVARLAESAFAELDPTQQRIARRLLLRLAADGPRGEVVRRRIELDELDAEAEGQVRAVIELLADARLLTLSASSVEVAHEALLREWPRLRGWLEADAQSRRVHHHLAQAATDWEERGRDPADLYRGARLAVAREWLSTHGSELDTTQRAFLDTSRTAAERQQRRLRLALAGAAALLAVAVVGAVVAVHQRSAARHQTETAVAQRVSLQALNEPDLDRSLLLARQGVAVADSAFTRGNLLRAILRSPAATSVIRGEGNPVFALDIDRRGRTLVIGDTQGNVERLDVTTRRVIRRLHVAGPVTAVRLSPDGSRLAVTHVDDTGTGSLGLFDARTFALVAPTQPEVQLPLVDITSPVFSPDSRVLAADVDEEVTSTFDRRDLLRWNAHTGQQLGGPLPFTSPATQASPDAKALALGGFIDGGERLVSSNAGNDTTVIRDARSLRTVRDLHGGGSPVALSADGRFFAVTDATSRVRLLDLRTGRLRPLGSRAGRAISAATFTPDSSSLVTANSDATLTIWDAQSGRSMQIIGPLPAVVGALGISKDGRTAYGADENGAVIAWDLTGRRAPGQPLRVPGHRPVAIAVSAPPASAVAVADADSGLQLLDLGSRAPVRQIPVPGGADTVAVAPDGRTAALGGHDGSVGFADLRTGRLLGMPELSHVNAVREIAFSPDGRWVATTDGTVVFLWDARARRHTAAFQGVTGKATSMSFSRDSRMLIVADGRPDGSGALDLLTIPRLALIRQAVSPSLVQLAASRTGKMIFGADRAGRVWLLNAGTLRPIGAPLLANANRFAIDPANRLLATSSAAGAVQLWDVRSGRRLGGPLPGIGGGPARLAFTANGSALVTLRPDGTGFVWDVRPRSWARRACAIAGRRLTVQEWRDSLHEISYSPACAAHK